MYIIRIQANIRSFSYRLAFYELFLHTENFLNIIFTAKMTIFLNFIQKFNRGILNGGVSNFCNNNEMPLDLRDSN